MKSIITVMITMALFACASSPALAANGEKTAFMFGLLDSLVINKATDSTVANDKETEKETTVNDSVLAAPKPVTDSNHNADGALVAAALVGLVVNKYPIGSTVVALLIALMPLLQLLANSTPNPKDNALLIFINKVLQSLTLTSSKNQINTASWSTLLTTRPKHWPDAIRTEDVLKVHKKVTDN
mgnify:CR=1 FL=1|jgi:hypothetical protein